MATWSVPERGGISDFGGGEARRQLLGREKGERAGGKTEGGEIEDKAMNVWAVSNTPLSNSKVFCFWIIWGSDRI